MFEFEIFLINTWYFMSSLIYCVIEYLKDSKTDSFEKQIDSLIKNNFVGMFVEKSVFFILKLPGKELIFKDGLLVLANFIMDKKIFLDLCTIVDNFRNNIIQPVIDLFLGVNHLEKRIKICWNHRLDVVGLIVIHVRL